MFGGRTCVHVRVRIRCVLTNKQRSRGVRAVRCRGRGALTEGAEFKCVPDAQNEGDRGDSSLSETDRNSDKQPRPLKTSLKNNRRRQKLLHGNTEGQLRCVVWSACAEQVVETEYTRWFLFALKNRDTAFCENSPCVAYDMVLFVKRTKSGIIVLFNCNC